MAKTKYTDELAERIAGHIENLVPLTFAPALEGIHYATFNTWLNGGGGIPKAKVDHFNERIQRAKAVAVQSRIRNIQRAGDTGDWKADAWYLEHVYSDDFASKSRSEITGRDGDALTVSIIRDHAPEVE